MNKRNFLKKSLAGLGLLSLPAITKAADPINGKFVHTVLFWLNEGTDVKDFMKGTEAFLQKVEVVRSYHVGVPAMTPREIVDNSYSVCLVVTFDTKEDQDVYQKHQAHLDYVEARKDQWSKVVIYDSWGG